MENKVFEEIKKEGGSFALLLIALALAFVMYPVGILWSLLIKPLWHIFVMKDPAYAGKRWLRYFGNFFYQVWSFIKTVFYFLGYLIDVLGNVFSGELIEDIITPMEDTMLGRGDNITISVAVGEIEQKALKNPSNMNGRGWWLSRKMNGFEADHAINAFKVWKYRKKLKADSEKKALEKNA